MPQLHLGGRQPSAAHGRLDDAGIAFAMVSEAPIEKLEAWRKDRGWNHTWVSSGATTYHDDFGWKDTDDAGERFWSLLAA